MGTEGHAARSGSQCPDLWVSVPSTKGHWMSLAERLPPLSSNLRLEMLVCSASHLPRTRSRKGH